MAIFAICQPWLQYYNSYNNMNPDVYVTSIEDFLQELPKTERFFNDIADKAVLYRGQADETWSLLPAVFRNEDDYMNESLYAREIQKWFAGDFKGLDKLEMLIKMQHYGVPTRLLDFTTNPLVALYFACREKRNTTGAVYCIDGAVFHAGRELAAKIIAEYVFEFKAIHPEWNSILELQIRDSIGRDYFRNAKSDFVETVLTSGRPFYINSTAIDPRVKYQAGCFAVFNGFNRNHSTEYSKIIGIRAEDKEPILKELFSVGIHGGLLFFDMSSGARDIIDIVRLANESFNRKLNIKNGI